MALFEGKTPAERNKLIAAIVMPVVALVFIVYMFSGPSTPTRTTANANANRRAQTKSTQSASQQNAPAASDPAVEINDMTEVKYEPPAYGGPEAGRNIFAFYEKPVAVPSASVVPTPTPTPPPPWTLASLAPQSVFARTAGFTLQLSGDKFGIGARVYIDDQAVPTQYKSMQQLTANVPASTITNPGQRSVVVRSPDGKLYSNQATLNVMQPPAPTYTYVGFLKRPRSNSAILKDQRGELYTVREGDVVEGRFRVTAISDRGVEVVDKDLNVKHTLPFISTPGATALQGRAPGSIHPPPASEDGGDEEP
jgi:hypothetical protein